MDLRTTINFAIFVKKISDYAYKSRHSHKNIDH